MPFGDLADGIPSVTPAFELRASGDQMALMGKNAALGGRWKCMSLASGTCYQRAWGRSPPSESLHALSRAVLRGGVKCLVQCVLGKEKLLSPAQSPVLLLFECTINISLGFLGVFISTCPHEATLAKSPEKESFLY